MWFWVWGYMRTVAVMLALLVLMMPISGCFGDEPVQSPEPEGRFLHLGISQRLLGTTIPEASTL